MASVVREYMAANPTADRSAVTRAASGMDADCSGQIHQCEAQAASHADGASDLTRDIARFMNERELQAFGKGLEHTGFEYKDEPKKSSCDLLVSDASRAQRAGVRVGGRA